MAITKHRLNLKFQKEKKKEVKTTNKKTKEKR